MRQARSIAGVRICLTSIDPVGPLQRADIGNNFLNLVCRYAFDRRHVAEAPMMRTNTILSGSLKRSVTMMVGFVDNVNQRRRHAVLTRGILAMAGCAFVVEQGLS